MSVLLYGFLSGAAFGLATGIELGAVAEVEAVRMASPCIACL